MYRHYPLEASHQWAAKASAAVECAGQQHRYWEMHDQLFASPQHLTEKDLLKYASTLKLDVNGFRTCVETPQGPITEDQAEAQRLGVQSTPTFFLGKLL